MTNFKLIKTGLETVKIKHNDINNSCLFGCCKGRFREDLTRLSGLWGHLPDRGYLRLPRLLTHPCAPEMKHANNLKSFSSENFLKVSRPSKRLLNMNNKSVTLEVSPDNSQSYLWMVSWKEFPALTIFSWASLCLQPLMSNPLMATMTSPAWSPRDSLNDRKLTCKWKGWIFKEPENLIDSSLNVTYLRYELNQACHTFYFKTCVKISQLK